jgi:peptide/nickel transport system substrate-binding protein
MTQTTPARGGDRVLDASGSAVELSPDVIVQDAQGNYITYDGAPISMERMVVTFTLRSGLRWSDGEPLTASDSVYSFQIASDSATPTDKHLIERTADYRALDRHRVVWRGIPGLVDRAYFLNFWHPLPRHAWGSLSAAELLTAEASTKRPLGWGPFALRESESATDLTAERNPFYFRAGEGLPHLDAVVFHFAEDTNTLVQEFLAGGCDVLTQETADLVPAAVGESGLPPEVRTLVTRDTAWELLAFGISPAAGYDRPDLFEDVRVRRAIAQCVDRQGAADLASATDGHVAHSYLPPEHPLYAGERLTTWDHDPDGGRLLLAQAGWYDEDGDGVREAHGIAGIADGTPFQASYHTTEDPIRLRTAQLMQNQLRACGIQVSLRTLQPETLFEVGPQGALFGRRFDLAQFSWRAAEEPMCELFLSSQIPSGGDWGRPNVAGFIDGEYDQACRRALRALPGRGDYLAAHAEAQRIFSEQLPVLPLFQRQRLTLAWASVSGLAPNTSQPSELWNLEQIDAQR